MSMSGKKLLYLKPLVTICFPPAIFCIVEPIVFGSPIVLNPFLIILFAVTYIITGVLTYMLTSVGFIGKMYLALPWATPFSILGYLAPGGSTDGFIIIFINLAIGTVTFYPL